MVGRTELDRIARKGCETPNCNHRHEEDDPVYLHPRCHSSAGTWASYRAGSGVLRIICKQCRNLVAEIAVGEPPELIG